MNNPSGSCTIIVRFLEGLFRLHICYLMLFLLLPCLLQYGESGLEHIYPVSFPVEEPYDIYSLILRIDRVANSGETAQPFRMNGAPISVLTA